MEHFATVPERIAYLAHHCGVEPSVLAKYAGLAPNHVRMITGGKIANPSSATVANLARVCGVTSEWLLLGRGPAPDPDAVRSHVATVGLGYAAAKRTET